MGTVTPETLLDTCARAFPDRRIAGISGVTDLSTGWESELHAFVLEWGTGADRRRDGLVLRLYPGDGGAAKSAHEFRSMRRLRGAGYPVPEVFALEQGDVPFGKPFILMEKIDGGEMWPLLSRSSEKIREDLLTLFCELFVRLHALDWRIFSDEADRDADDPYRFVDGWLRVARETIRNSPEYVDFLPVAAWLEERRDALPCRRPSPVHQDFHPNNVMVRPDGSAVVIDWTGFAVTDPRFDLAWTTMLAYVYAGTELRDRILHEYARLSGAPVEHIACFEVCACARRLHDIAVSLSEGAERQGMRPEVVAAMRRQKAQIGRVYDMLTERTGLRIPRVETLIASLA